MKNTRRISMISMMTAEEQAKYNNGGSTLIYINKKENKSGSRPVIPSTEKPSNPKESSTTKK